MLRLNILIVVSFIFYLDVINSSPDYYELLRIYYKKLDYEETSYRFKPSKNLPYDRVCNRPKEYLATLCKIVIRRLRSENKEIYNNFYMNYLPYTVQKPCIDVKVWLNRGNRLAHQTAVSCFVRPAIMTLDSSEEMASFYRKIVVYPWNARHVLVFEYNENEKYYTVLKYYRIHWKELHQTGASLFYAPIPQGWREVLDLYSILHPIYSTLNDYSTNQNNIVNTKDMLTFLRICYVVLRTENYDRKLYFDGKNKKHLPHKLRAILRGPNSDLSVSITAYTCDHSFSKDTTLMSKYYVTAGPSDHSVILLEKVGNDNNNYPRYKIIQFIEYLTKEYIIFYFNTSY